MEIYAVLKQKEAAMLKVLEEIIRSKTVLTSEQAKKWIVALTFFGLLNFLACLEHAVRAEEKWAYHTRLILEHFINTFGDLLLMGGKTYPDLMDSAIEIVKQKLEALSSCYAP